MARDPMKVEVEEIPDGGFELRVDAAVPGFAALLRDATEGDGQPEGRATLHFERWPERVDVTGELAASIPQTCVRCLNPFTGAVERAIHQILLREHERPEGEVEEEEIQLTVGDLDRSELVDDKVDVLELLREELELALPLKPLCAEECQGICPGCGAELNQEECTCEPEVDPRWDALKGLKLGE